MKIEHIEGLKINTYDNPGWGGTIIFLKKITRQTIGLCSEK